jgi:hypothetical protein
MTARKGPSCTIKPRHLHGERIKDEVYRRMFLLEENRPGAEMGLALALLHAWQECDSKQECGEREWLRKISPICLQMIEDFLRARAEARSCGLREVFGSA